MERAAFAGRQSDWFEGVPKPTNAMTAFILVERLSDPDRASRPTGQARDIHGPSAAALPIADRRFRAKDGRARLPPWGQRRSRHRSIVITKP